MKQNSYGLTKYFRYFYFQDLLKCASCVTVGSHMDSMESIESLLIDLPTLRLSTNNFAENNKLGEGGFGSVYRVGTLFWYMAYLHILCV